MTSQSLSNLALGAVEAAERAAIAAARLAGHGDKIAADQAAVDAMRKAFNDMPMRGRIVIGEGERDEAPMLYIGEEVGTGEGPEIDIALDPLEGTSLTAGGKPEALTLLALAPRGGLLHAPDTYMDKIAVGPGLPQGVIDLDKPVGENLAAIAKAKGVPVSEITVCVLERERHQKIIDGIRAAGARVVLIPDGDVAAVIAAADPSRPIDMYVGQGGAPEGVLSAAALRCLGGQIECRLFFRNDDERARAAKTGIKDLDRKYSGAELASKDCLFVASGVTGGQLLDAVTYGPGTVTTQTLLLSSAPRSRRVITTQRFLEGS
jgi:fructose-1,6-bisphosphatase II / sedoheptulose-1,7-bisphosphatase